MSEQTPVPAAGLPGATTQQPVAQPTSGIQAIAVFGATIKHGIIMAVKEPYLESNLVSKACVESLGHLYDPIDANVFLPDHGGNTLDPIGILELNFFNQGNSKQSWFLMFIVVRDLWTDMVLGKEACELVAIERGRGAFPFGMSKETEDEKNERERKTKEAVEASLRVEAQQKEAKRQMNNIPPKGGSSNGKGAA